MPRKVFPPIGKKKSTTLIFKDKEYGIRERARELVRTMLNLIDRGMALEIDYEDLIQIVSTTKIELDSVVTMDISRLSRFINSINGKAGLAVCKVSPDPSYEPEFDHYRVFYGKAIVVPQVDLPEITILGKKVRIRRGEKIYLDATLSFYLGIRDIVKIIDISMVEVKKPRS